MLFRAVSDKIKCISTFKTTLRFFYDSRTRYDTIFAPSTAIQPIKGSPLGVIRVSGIKTEQVIHQLTRYSLSRSDSASENANHGAQKKVIKPRQATLANIITPDTDELIDIGLVLWFPGPQSYTGEDVCEFHLHGSQAVMTTMLGVLGTIPGLRPAEPGEFTRRAVLNAKMSLIQAESLPDLIASQTDYQRKLALRGLDGSTRDRYEVWIKNLIDTLAHLEASIDFGEDELIGERAVVDNCISKLNDLSEEISHYLKVSTHCREFIQSGVRVAILGRPNAGKSTFMNLLCRRDKSIVSGLSGTTRDVVEHSFDLGGHAITLCDTAGLKDLNLLSTSNNPVKTLLEQHASVERQGIRRALEAAKKASIILYLVDGSKLRLDETDLIDITKQLVDVLRIVDGEKESKAIHLVINKIDLNVKLFNTNCDKELETLLKAKSHMIRDITTTSISCTTQENFDLLLGELTKRLDNLMTSLSSENKHGTPKLDYVNERHLSLLMSTQRHLERASKLNLDTIDEMAQHVRESLDYLSRIVGSVSNEQVIDVIFRDFCIGK